MSNKISQLIFSPLVKNILFLLLLLSFIFSRSFTGIYIFDLRIGEYLMAVAFVIYVITVLTDFENNPLRMFTLNFRIIFILLFLFFLLSMFSSNSSFINPYTYKTSTYIWSFSFLFLGLNSKKIKLSLTQFKFLQTTVLFVYFTSVFGYPNFIIELLIQISDKYELHKGSDLALFYIIFTIVINHFLEYNKVALNAFVYNSCLYLPLLLFKSRTAFLACVLIFLNESYKHYNSKNIKITRTQKAKLIIVSIFLVSISTYFTQNKNIPEEIDVELISNSYTGLVEYRLKHYQKDYPFLYFQDERIYSGDGNLNWRLIMWQDAIEDNIVDQKIIIGIGYKEKFKVFIEDNTGFGNDRRGLDQLNEQIHNYFITILLRGGLIQLFLVFNLYFIIIKTKLNKSDKKSMVFFILSVLFISSFDSSMENSHFPLIFYYFLGNFYLADKMI